jgi:DNA-nicking Smr family endonuclease
MSALRGVSSSFKYDEYYDYAAEEESLGEEHWAPWEKDESGQEDVAVEGHSVDEQVEMLMRVFPDMDPDSLYERLHNLGYDLLGTVETLLAELDGRELESGEVKDVVETKQVCKYFLMGDCRVRNCPYLHEIAHRSALCKYWLKGFCARGEECAFLHSLEHLAPSTAPSKPAESFLTLRTEQSTPSSSIMKPMEVPAKPLGVKKPMDLAAKMKLDGLIKEFSHVHKDIVTETFESFGYHAGRSRDQLSSTYGDPNSSLSSPKSIPKAMKPKLGSRVASKPVVPATDVKWVDTGATVDKLYLQSRKEAEEHCRLRNAYFMQATSAFLAGNGKLARELSRLGREHDAKAEKLHSQAAEKIFDSRNSSQMLSKGMIDVHGLHPSEALSKIERLLAESKRAFFDIIVGTGHHSFDSKAKVRPAVITWLKKNNYSFRELDAPGSKMGGLLRVSLR